MVLVSIAEGAGNHQCYRINSAIILYYAAFHLCCISKNSWCWFSPSCLQDWFDLRLQTLQEILGSGERRLLYQPVQRASRQLRAMHYESIHRSMCACVYGRGVTHAMHTRSLSLPLQKTALEYQWKIICTCQALVPLQSNWWMGF